METSKQKPKTRRIISAELHSELQEFLGVYTKRADGSVVKEGPDALTDTATSTVIELIRGLHDRPVIALRDVVRYRDKINAVTGDGKISKKAAMRMLYKSFGMKDQTDFDEACISSGPRMILDRTKALRVEEALFYSLIQEGQVKKTADVKIPELMPYADQSLIDILVERSDKQKELDAMGTNRRLREIEDKIIENPYYLLTRDEKEVLKKSRAGRQTLRYIETEKFPVHWTENMKLVFTYIRLSARELTAQMRGTWLFSQTGGSEKAQTRHARLNAWLDSKPYKQFVTN